MRNLATALACLIASGVASAGVVIDFNGVANGAANVAAPSPYVEDGFSLTTGTAGDLFSWARPSANNADPTGATMSDAFAALTNSLTKNGGGAFRFNSIQLADLFNDQQQSNKQTVLFTFALAGGGTTTRTVNTDGLAGLQTFTFNDVADVLSASWKASSGTSTSGLATALQFDNIVLDGGPPVSVPEPMSLALVGIGLAALRVNKRKAVRA
jgi:hypothetical protein